MLEVEPYIIVLIDHLSKMRVPIKCRQGLELANSLVSGKSIMENIVLWRRRRNIAFHSERIQHCLNHWDQGTGGDS